MDFLNAIKDRLPEHAKDIRLNLDAVIGRSSLAAEDALGVALAAALTTDAMRPTSRNCCAVQPSFCSSS